MPRPMRHVSSHDDDDALPPLPLPSCSTGHWTWAHGAGGGGGDELDEESDERSLRLNVERAILEEVECPADDQ